MMEESILKKITYSDSECDCAICWLFNGDLEDDDEGEEECLD